MLDAIKKFVMVAVIVTIIFILAILSILLIETWDEIDKHDLLVQKAATCNLKVKSPIYLITFGEGEVYISNEKVLAESALNKCVDIIYMYRKEHLDEVFVQKNKKILEAKRGAGYWLWKPYVMLKTLHSIPEGSIVMYIDSGLKIMKPLDEFVNNLTEADIVLQGFSLKNKNYIKRDLLKMMNMDNEETREAGQINAAMFAVRNTSYTRNFMQQWLEIGEKEGVIDDSPSKEEYPDFVEHRHDQSILSLLYLQNASSIKLVPADDVSSLTWHHRRKKMKHHLYLFRSENDPQKMTMISRLLYELLREMRYYFPE